MKTPEFYKLVESDGEGTITDVAKNKTLSPSEAVAELNRHLQGRIDFSHLVHNAIVAMQCALIEQNNGNPEKGLEWIANYLWGPGHLPDASIKDADAHCKANYTDIGAPNFYEKIMAKMGKQA